MQFSLVTGKTKNHVWLVTLFHGVYASACILAKIVILVITDTVYDIILSKTVLITIRNNRNSGNEIIPGDECQAIQE